MTSSPFTTPRFEFEGQHVYHLPARTLEVLEGSQPVYLIGSRGTGKTTLLKSLSWGERLSNSSLQAALDGKPFKTKILGVYLKLSRTSTSVFDAWLAELSLEMQGQVLGLFIDLAWLEYAFLGLATLSAERVVTADPAEEHSFVADLLDLFPELSASDRARGEHTFFGLSRRIRELRRTLDRYSRLQVDPSVVVEEYPVGPIGHLGRALGQHIGDFCDRHSDDSGSRWRIKVCLDEAESLTKLELQALNTVVRLAEHPVFQVAAFVRMPDDPVSTMVHGLTCQSTDRLLHVLDNPQDPEFQAFGEGVATLRLRAAGSRAKPVSLTRLLGELDINRLLETILGQAESEAASGWLESARLFAKQFGTEDEAASLPIYQAYIQERLALDLDVAKRETRKRRAQASREIRKRMVAAYLCLCSELRQRPRFAFSQMLVQMSDGCIRDFLQQLHHLYLEDPKAFTGSRTISLGKQDRALQRASREKVDRLPTESGVTAPGEIHRLVHALAQWTADLQAAPPREQALRASERGRFTVEFDRSSDRDSHLESLLHEAADAGFLRILPDEGPCLCFRVHTSLAPAYGFSYRGAYYPTVLSPSVLEEVRAAAKAANLKDLVAGVSRDLRKSQHLPLFDSQSINEPSE